MLLPARSRALCQPQFDFVVQALEEVKKTLQADKAAVTGDKMNLELQLKSTGARLLLLEKENEKLREKAGKIGEARSEAQQVHVCTRLRRCMWLLLTMCAGAGSGAGC
jgi:hypothetical protein